MGSSLAFSPKEDPVRCAKVCDKSWVILEFIRARKTLEAFYSRDLFGIWKCNWCLTFRPSGNGGGFRGANFEEGQLMYFRFCFTGQNQLNFGHFRQFLAISTIFLDNFWPFWTTFGRFLQLIFGHIGQFLAIFYNFWPCWTIFGHFRQFLAILDTFWPFSSINFWPYLILAPQNF